MKLMSQSHSPFARKVIVLIRELEIADVTIEHHETSPTNKNPAVFALNPLGKVPVLLREDGKAIYDSSAICEYLCERYDNGGLLPLDTDGRILARRLQSLASGICEAGIDLRWETLRRPEALRYDKLRDGQIEKLSASYAHLEQHNHLLEAVTIGTIAMACALDWVRFRALDAHVPQHPKLAAWLERFSERPSMRATRYEGETQD